jgi:hypothetical protein
MKCSHHHHHHHHHHQSPAAAAAASTKRNAQQTAQKNIVPTDLYSVCVCVSVSVAGLLAALVYCTWKRNIWDCICRQMVESLAVVVGSF